MTIRVFVGTDERMQKAEAVLEHSIRKHTPVPVDITWMRAGEPGFDDWNMGRKPGKPYTAGWATDFTNFRFAVPELAGFEGKAIYLDADMMVLRDLRHLLAKASLSDCPWVCPGLRTEVSVIDCSKFGWENWPYLHEMRESGWSSTHYIKRLQDQHMIDGKTIGGEWNCCDGRGYKPGETGIYHFTDMHLQPWKPWPERFEYPRHPHKAGVDLFWKLYEEACGDTNLCRE